MWGLPQVSKVCTELNYIYKGVALSKIEKCPYCGALVVAKQRAWFDDPNSLEEFLCDKCFYNWRKEKEPPLSIKFIEELPNEKDT